MTIRRIVNEDRKTLGRNALRRKGTEVFSPARPTKVKPEPDDLIITANEGDRLDALASKFYGSSRLWFVIASVNNLTNGSMHIKPGTQLRIPSRDRVV
ncbi:hypothetical protein LCGC14_1004090 [marine sediment metagenome]|uniref:LysM domain-containing protein n=1 Tax=marine sediment metagenome TaxID=412755 RepID=A0A0F9QKI0_9ZZZZ